MAATEKAIREGRTPPPPFVPPSPAPPPPPTPPRTTPSPIPPIEIEEVEVKIALSAKKFFTKKTCQKNLFKAQRR